MTTNSILSVSFIQRPSGPGYDPSTDDVGEDVVCVGSAFRYIIPSFSVLAVEMRQVRMTATGLRGREVTHDIFILNDPSLIRTYPTLMKSKMEFWLM